MVNEPLVFEPSRFDCRLNNIRPFKLDFNDQDLIFKDNIEEQIMSSSKLICRMSVKLVIRFLSKLRDIVLGQLLQLSRF